MSFIFHCPYCQSPMTVPDHLAGTAATCAHCRQAIRLPAAPVAVAPPDAPTQAAPTTPPRRRRSPVVAIVLVVVVLGLLGGGAYLVSRLGVVSRIIHRGPAEPVTPPGGGEAAAVSGGEASGTLRFREGSGGEQEHPIRAGAAGVADGNLLIWLCTFETQVPPPGEGQSLPDPPAGQYSLQIMLHPREGGDFAPGEYDPGGRDIGTFYLVRDGNEVKYGVLGLPGEDIGTVALTAAGGPWAGTFELKSSSSVSSSVWLRGDFRVPAGGGAAAGGSAATEYDGDWEGVTSEGPSVRFEVRNGSITHISVGFSSTGLEPGARELFVMSNEPVPIDPDGVFSSTFSLYPRQAIEGTFASASEAKGTYTAGGREMTWTATRVSPKR